jgi:hypothetical protein
MANNRRASQSGAIRFVPACKAILLCSLIGGSCVGYVLQKNKLYELGQQIGARQQKLERTRKENQVLAKRLSEMQLPQRLVERVRELKLGLVAPEPSQMLWITEVPQPGAAPSTNAAPWHYVQTGVPR